MTQPPPPPTDTPAPADGAGEGLNAEIALLFGYQWRLGGSIGSQCRFLSPPDTEEGRETVGVNYPAYTMDEAFPLATEADKVCRDWNHYVPRYDSDPATALGLLSDIASRESTMVLITRSVSGVWSCDIRELTGDILGVADAETLEMAIATACRDALAAIGKAEGGTS